MILYISYPTIINTKHQKLDNLKIIIYNLNTVNTDGNFFIREIRIRFTCVKSYRDGIIP